MDASRMFGAGMHALSPTPIHALPLLFLFSLHFGHVQFKAASHSQNVRAVNMQIDGGYPLMR